MRLDARRQAETEKRKGSAVKTILGLIWLSICFAAAYYFVGWLFESGELTPGFFWNKLFIPRVINLTGLKILVSVVIVVIMNFFLLIGYGLSSLTGRTRPGTPSMQSRNPDPNDQRYDY